jgi:hypothetical protein
LQTQLKSTDDITVPVVRPLTDDEVSSVGAGLIVPALIYIYNAAKTSTGGNSDISSWAIA